MTSAILIFTLIFSIKGCHKAGVDEAVCRAAVDILYSKESRGLTRSIRCQEDGTRDLLCVTGCLDGPLKGSHVMMSKSRFDKSSLNH